MIKLEQQKIINLTPHDINVNTGIIVKTFKPSGVVCRLAVTQRMGGAVNGIPLVETVYGEIENLPDPKEGTVYLVSSMVSSQCYHRPDVMSPDTGPTAMRRKGKIICVTRFSK